MPKYKHIFFDLDHTIWDFESNSKQVLLELFDKYQLHKYICASNDFISAYKLENDKLWKEYRKGKIEKQELRSKRFDETLKTFGVFDVDLASELGDFYVSTCPYKTKLMPFAIDVLNYTSKKYKLHIITNGFEEVQVIKLRESGIAHYFDEVIMSEQVGVKKPHPLIFKRAFQRSAALPQESLMVGDDYYADIQGAERVNMDAIFFNPKMDLKKANNEISCLSELLNIL